MNPSNADLRNVRRRSLHEEKAFPNNISPEVSEDESDEIDENNKIGDKINKPIEKKSPSKIYRSYTPEPESKKKRPGEKIKVNFKNVYTQVLKNEYIKTSLNKAIPLLNTKYLVCFALIAIAAGVSLNTTPLNPFKKWFSSPDIFLDEYKNELFRTCAYKTKKNFNSQKTEIFDFLEEATSLPSVLMIIYNKGELESKCVATSMKKCFYNIYNLPDIPIELSGRTIKENERFEFFEEYMPKLEKSKFMLVLNLEGLNGEVAENFYSLCDLDNPAVPNTMIVFTLNVGDYLKRKSSPAEKARLFLDKHWKDLDISSRDPLITRLTSNVVEVTEEQKEFSCLYHP